MTTITPSFAIVRPCASTRDVQGSRPLDEIIAEIADELSTGLVWVVGGPGSGKSTALAHLKAIFEGDERLIFLDEPFLDERIEPSKRHLLVAATSRVPKCAGIVVRLQHWGVDELIEYMLGTNHDMCRSVIERLGSAATRPWSPQIACVVLDRFRSNALLADPAAAFVEEIQAGLPSPFQRKAAANLCLAILVGNQDFAWSASDLLAEIGCPNNIRALLRHPCVQLPLAADWLMSVLALRNPCRDLAWSLPRELVELVGERSRTEPQALACLNRLLRSRHAKAVHPMAASILLRANPDWRPSDKHGAHWRLSGGLFHEVDWTGVQLPHADLREAEFSNAVLRDANMEAAIAIAARFDGAALDGARLIGIHASRADFRNSSLKGAKMSISDFTHATFAGANLTGVSLVKSDLSAADLTEACFTGADLLVRSSPGPCYAIPTFQTLCSPRQFSPKQTCDGQFFREPALTARICRTLKWKISPLTTLASRMPNFSMPI